MSVIHGIMEDLYYVLQTIRRDSEDGRCRENRDVSKLGGIFRIWCLVFLL